MVIWLKEFIDWHKAIAATLTGSVRNQNLQESSEIQANDANKENESGPIENPLVSWWKRCPETKCYKSVTEKKENHAHIPVVYAVNQDTIAWHVKITRYLVIFYWVIRFISLNN